MKVLIVDQDPRIQKKMKRVLKDEFVVEVASNASHAESLFFENHFDLVILDLLLPDMDGDDFITLLKSYSKELPVIVISNQKSVQVKERVYERGADDFLEKPLNMSELRLRIKANLRRKNSYNEQIYVKEVQKGNLLLDREKKTVTYKEERIKLRKKELYLLEYLLLNKGRVVTRSDILDNIWESNANPFTNTVDVHVKRLRDKIEKPYNEHYIETVHGIGYLIEWFGEFFH